MREGTKEIRSIHTGLPKGHDQSGAISKCSALDKDGNPGKKRGDWVLPTLKQWNEAGSHGIFDVLPPPSPENEKEDKRSYWTSSLNPTNPNIGCIYNKSGPVCGFGTSLNNGIKLLITDNQPDRNKPYYVRCIRNP